VREEKLCITGAMYSAESTGDRAEPCSVSNFHLFLYDTNVSWVTCPEWYCLSQGDARENLPEGFGHWDGKWTWLSLIGSCQHASQEMLMVFRLLVMIQRWLSEAAKWDDFKVVDVP
jgi:hypothetical protein